MYGHSTQIYSSSLHLFGKTWAQLNRKVVGRTDVHIPGVFKKAIVYE